MSRFTRLGGLVLLLLGVMLLAAWLLLPLPIFAESAYGRIVLGMSMQEVEAVVSAPPGNYRVDRNEYWPPSTPIPRGDLIDREGRPIELVYSQNLIVISGSWQQGPIELRLVADGPVVSWFEERYAISVVLGEDGKVAGKARLRMRPSDLKPEATQEFDSPWVRWFKRFLP